MSEPVKINWYRCQVDKAILRELMRKSDLRGFVQAVGHLLLFAATGTLAYLAFRQVHAATWPWALPLLLAALFLHGSFASFFAGIACHELCHKTPFATQFWNGFFLRIYSFLSWFDPVGFRASHVRHHQVTTHSDYDGEVPLPQGADWQGVKYVLKNLTFNPAALFRLFRFWVAAACGNLRHSGMFNADWLQQVVPEDKQRRDIFRWARIMLFGHLALAAWFIASGHWFLIVIVNCGCLYCPWLATICTSPQHVGLSPNTPDFRLCCRTYTASWFPAFLYWNMQYHVEHHMFPAVPFYHLPKLRAAIAHDLPPAPHGLWATWRELLAIIRRQRIDPAYVYVPQLSSASGDRASDEVIQREAAQQT